MAEPPFAVPRGMEWDPHKRRFFKAKGKGAAAPFKQAQTPASAVHKRTAAHSAKARQDAMCASLPLTMSSSRGAAGRLHTPLSHSHAPRLGTVQASLRNFAANRLGSARFARLAGIDTQACVRQLGIHTLHSNPAMGSLLHFMTWNQQVCLIDTAQTHAHGVTRHVDVHLAELSWCGPKRAYQIAASPSSLPPTASALHTLLVQRALNGADAGTTPSLPACYAMDGEYMCMFTSPTELEVRRQTTVGATSQSKGRNVTVQDGERYQVKIPRAWPRDGYVTLSMRHARSTLVVCIGAGTWVYTFRIAVVNATGPAMRRMFKRLESDVIAHDIDATGEHVVVGCRNGRAVCLALPLDSPELEGEENTTVPGRTRVAEQDYMRVCAVGAVTNVKFVAADEVIMAFSNGQLVRLSVLEPSKPLMEYRGHVNSWTINPPIAFDAALRLLAVAGQDRRVRIWSLDQAEPLGDGQEGDLIEVDLHKGPAPASQRLCSTVFASDVTGLTFCHRHAVAYDEAQRNAAFLPRGVPALAIACGGSEVAFFE